MQTSGLQIPTLATVVAHLVELKHNDGTDEVTSATFKHVWLYIWVPLPHVFEQAVAGTGGPSSQTIKLK